MMRRTFAAAAIAATSLAATLVVAQPAQRPAPEQMAREPMTRTAVEQRAATMFARLDADGDGRLAAADREQHAAQRTADRFARLDTNSDGSISRDEFAAASEQRAGRWAERGSEAGDQSPRRAHARMGGMRGGPRQIMARADADRDGTVTQAEFTSAMLARFDAADANRDGTISPEERRARGRHDRPATR